MAKTQHGHRQIIIFFKACYFFLNKFKCSRVHFQVKSVAEAPLGQWGSSWAHCSSSWAVGLRTSVLRRLLARGFSQFIATGDSLYLVHMR